MFNFLTWGNASKCSAPSSPCTCEDKLYTTTGSLALVAGLTQWVVGYYYSMAALSDALHALSDASADFYAVFIAKKIRSNPSQTKKMRKDGDKAIALLLALGALIIGVEAFERWSADTYIVWLPAVALVGIFGLTIDLLRLKMLSRAREHLTNSNLEGLIEHARSDAWHSGIISFVAVLAMLGTFLDLEKGSYEFLVRLIDYSASLGLAGYMMFILTPRIWRGEGCGHKHEHFHSHGHGCDHEH